MHGIRRINITDKWPRGSGRMNINNKLQPAANRVYQAVFDLVDNAVDVSDCRLGSTLAKLDTNSGIDLWLTKKNGTCYSVQEKLLTKDRKTVTFTTTNNNGSPDLWTTCNANLWFVGYGRRLKYGDSSIQDWMVIDFRLLQDIAKSRSLPWRYGENKTDEEKAKFQYLDFSEMPPEVVLASSDVLGEVI